MRKVLLGSLLALLTACATQSPLQTFTQVYNAAITADDFAVTAATAALNAGLISSAQATLIQKITVDAMTLLNTANLAFLAGDSLDANKNVAAATGTLVALSLCLTQKPLTVATFSSCANSIPPLPAPTSMLKHPHVASP